jgi:hypothetical protein
MEYYTSIEEALAELRHEDKVVKILSNKYAVVQSAFIGGGYDTPSVCGLHKNKIYFYCKWFNEAKASFNHWESIPNIQRTIIAYYTNPQQKLGYVYRNKTIDNRKVKRYYRKIKQLLKLHYSNSSWIK